MTIPPPPPVPAARTAAPPRRDNGHPADPAAREFTDLVREHLQSEQTRARTEATKSAPAGPDQEPDAASVASIPLPGMPVAVAGLAVPPLVDEQGTALVAQPAAGDTATASGAAAAPAAGSSVAGSPASGPDTSTAGSPLGAGSVPAPAQSVPSETASALPPGSQPASVLDQASGSASASQPSSTIDAAAASDDAGGSQVRLDATGAAVSVAPSATPAGPTTSTASPSPAGPALDQALPVVTRLVSRGDGTHRMTLKLYPVELGEIQLTVTVRGDRVDVTFAAGAQAREALREGAGQLRGLLELAGRTTGHLLVRDLPGATAATPTPHPPGAGSASTGTPFGHDAAGGSWGGGHDSAGPGGSRTHGAPGRTERTPTGPTPTTAPTPTVSPATALDVRL